MASKSSYASNVAGTLPDKGSMAGGRGGKDATVS